MKLQFLSAVLALSLAAYSQGIRKNYTEMTSDEKSDYLTAWNALYNSTASSDIVQALSNWYGAHYNTINYNSGDGEPQNEFLAWDRMALWEMEKALQAENARLTIPYWNWYVNTSSSDALFTNFLPTASLNSNWGVTRSVGSTGTLPTTDVTGCMLNSMTDWWRAPLPPPNINFPVCMDDPGSVYAISPGMETRVHTPVRTWVGGDMNTIYAPIDPVYYVHAAMMDKLWQKWEDRSSTTSAHTITVLSRYDGSTTGPVISPLPNTNPDNIVNGRTSHGTYYTEGGVATLDDGYAVTNAYRNPEYFNYQYDIVAGNFGVPAGKSAIIHSNTQIRLQTGFVSSGSLILKVGDYDTPLAKRGVPQATGEPLVLGGGILSASRTADALQIVFRIQEASPVTVEAFSPRGTKLSLASPQQRFTTGRHVMEVPLQVGYRGVVYLRLTTRNQVYQRALSLL